MKKKNKQFAVLGLGRFGMSILKTLSEYNVHILACDKDEHILKEASVYATHTVRADVSDEYALKELGLGNFDVVILAMGEDFEASLIAAMTAKELGAGFILAKARGMKQKKILESIGADQVVLPEHEMGEKTARNLIGFNIVDILAESDQYVISEMSPLPEWINKNVQDADIRKKHNIFILAVRTDHKLIVPVPADYRFKEHDKLITLSETFK